MKYKKIIYLLLLAFSTSFVGCDEWLDVNKDPNNLSELTSPEAVMPVAQLAVGNALMGWEMGFSGAFWSQYWTQDHTSSQFKFLDEYDVTSFSYAYENLVPYALNDLKAIITNSEMGSGNYLVAEALSIYAWQIITDTWGDMPYFEALQGDEGLFSPKFDSQEEIYNDLFSRVNALLEMDFSGADISDKYDFIYHGDVSAWVAFAKSLKLKLMLRLSETSGYNNAEVLEFAKKGGFITETAKISGDIWESKDGKRHPMVEFADAGYFDNVIASKTMIEYLNKNEDPRIGKLYEVTSTGTYVGSLQGDFAYDGDSNGNGTADQDEEYSKVVFDNDADIILMSTWEVNFYLAEVYARAGDSAAKAYYDAAVQASLDYWGVSGTITAGSEYAEWPAGTLEENIKAIAMQKWVAYCKLQHIEAFLERNRTKYPSVNAVEVKTPSDRTDIFLDFPVGDFTISVAGLGRLSGNLPSSPTYPNSIISRNTTKPQQKTSIGEKVWWDQKSGK